jgi:hypothetical protein
MAERPLPIKYVLFSHYGKYEETDFKDFSKEKHGRDLRDLKGISYLLSHFRGLRELLTAPGHQGILVLFYAPGYARFLEKLAHPGGGNPEPTPQQREEDQKLEFAAEVKRFVVHKLRDAKLDDRVRFLTSHDLGVILNQTNEFHANLFKEFFLGPAKGIRYDSPKVVEAILRLRVLGNGVPVLRLDHDVLFRGRTDIGDLGLFKAVACALRAYQLRMADPTVSTFLFSASYNSKMLLNRPHDFPVHDGAAVELVDRPDCGTDPKPDQVDPFEAWGRAFATRIYPALIADPDEIKGIFDLKEEMPSDRERKVEAWDNYASKHVDERLTRQFFGLTEDTTKLETAGTTGLASIGAHPLYAVISGALLCLSDGAILDLPPYSNLGTNVMWIDDHLKYSLHRAMNHFTSGDTLNLEEGLSDARLDDVSVTKARSRVDFPPLPVYILDVYLPTLLWGAVFDAWITKNPILKLRVKDKELKQPSKMREWKDAREAQHTAALPFAMIEALRTGGFSLGSERTLKEDLRRIAVDRIERVRQLWVQVKNGERKTFACYWAEGTVQQHFDAGRFRGRNLWSGIGKHPLQPITTIFDLESGLADKLRDLIDDAVNYVKWTLEWPKFVQIVRSIRQGTFVGDLGWKP